MNLNHILNKVESCEVVNVCQDLIRIRSVNPPGEERAVAQYAADYLHNLGFNIEMIEHASQRASLLARLPGDSLPAGQPGLMLSGHLDTVAPGAEVWKHDPFGGIVSGGKLIGRGASDMKSGVATILVAARAFAQSGLPRRVDLVLALTAGEEVDCLGATAIAARRDLPPLQAILVAEPSSNELYIDENGALFLELRTTGRTAHGSMPDLGVNAIRSMLVLLAELDRLDIAFEPHPLLGGFTRSLNTLNGGFLTNVIPDACTATLDLRTVPGQEHAALVSQIEGVIQRLARENPAFHASVHILTDRPPVTTGVQDQAVTRFQSAYTRATARETTPAGVRYFSDAAVLVPAFQAPMLICGPGIAAQAHQPNEYVEVDKLEEAVRIYTAVLVEFLT